MDNNFILPETEKSLNLIISKIQRFFEIVSVVFSVFYAAYTVCRIIFLEKYLVLNIVLSVIAWGIVVINFLEFFKKIQFAQKLHLVIEIIKRTVIVLIFVLTFISLFSAYNELLPYRVLVTMLCGVGIIISIIGDVFNATIPAWTQIVLDSFKSDIEISGLAERSFDQLKEELKKDEFKEKIASGAIYAGTSIVRNVFKNLFKNKNQNNNDSQENQNNQGNLDNQ